MISLESVIRFPFVAHPRCGGISRSEKARFPRFSEVIDDPLQGCVLLTQVNVPAAAAYELRRASSVSRQASWGEVCRLAEWATAVAVALAFVPTSAVGETGKTAGKARITASPTSVTIRWWAMAGTPDCDPRRASRAAPAHPDAANGTKVPAVADTER